MKAYQYDKAKMIIDGLIALVWYWVAWSSNQNFTIRIAFLLLGTLWLVRVGHMIIRRPHIEITNGTIIVNQFFRTNIYNIDEIRNIVRVVRTGILSFNIPID